MNLKTFLDKFGIEKGYSNLRMRWSKAADFFMLCRPFTLLGAWIAGFFLDILFSKPTINILHAIQVGFSLALLQAGGQALNQSLPEEIEIDKLNGKTYRPTVSGRISLQWGKRISAGLFISGILLALNLSVKYGIFSTVITFFAIAYTAPPFRVKKYLFLNNLWQGISRGLLPGIYVSLNYPKYGSLPIYYGLALAIWVTGAQTSKDFGDELGDKAFKIKTLPVVFGRKGALKIMIFFMMLGFLCLNGFIYFTLLPRSFFLLNLLLLPSASIIYSLRIQIKMKYAENNLGWVLWYGTLGLFYIIPAFII